MISGIRRVHTVRPQMDVSLQPIHNGDETSERVDADGADGVEKVVWTGMRRKIRPMSGKR